MGMITTLLVLYILTSIYYFYQSSKPTEPCFSRKGADNHCLQPLLFTAAAGRTPRSSSSNHDESSSSSSYLLLELYVPSLIIKDQEDTPHFSNNHNGNSNSVGRPSSTKSKFEWVLVSNCTSSSSSKHSNKDGRGKFKLGKGQEEGREQMIFPDFNFQYNGDQNDDDTLSLLFKPNANKVTTTRTTTKHCHITLPNFSRQRTNNTKTMNIFKGKFILKRVYKHQNSSNDSNHHLQQQQQQQHIILAETIFDLTRIIYNTKNNEFTPFYKYFKQPLVLRIVTDRKGYPIHNPVRGDGYFMQRVKMMDQKYYYRPIFYVDEVALRQSSQIELALPPSSSSSSSSTTTTTNTYNNNSPKPPVKLSIKITFISPLRHVIQNQIQLSIDMAEKILGPHELDEIRYLISDEYMYRFIITQIIGLIHLSLDYLAFKNEIRFYVGRGKDVTGISLSSIYSRFLCELIIFLYLLDGGNTSWFVLFSVGSSVGVELWKLLKFLQPRWNNTQTFPFITFRDLSKLSLTEQLTVDYDNIARTYLSMILFPLVLGLAWYQKQFYTYSSHYSWMISNLANAVYTFGFITLCPQLYINYRLKSVAHMPWKVFIYKIFNTFVDDVFAFLIDMPMKHKIMTLRDDIVFVIFLVQAYIYRVDKTRANEFGYAYEEVRECKIDNILETKDCDKCQDFVENHVKLE